MNHDPSSRDRLQNHEMAHVPVHDRGQVQLPKVVKFEAYRSAGELHLARHLDQRPERDPFQRYRIATPKGVQIDAVAVIRANHGQAGESAFSCFGLPNNRESPQAAEIQKVRHDYILTLSSGSRNHLITERFSRMISALSSIPAWSGMRLP